MTIESLIVNHRHLKQVQHQAPWCIPEKVLFFCEPVKADSMESIAWRHPLHSLTALCEYTAGKASIRLDSRLAAEALIHRLPATEARFHGMPVLN